MGRQQERESSECRQVRQSVMGVVDSNRTHNKNAGKHRKARQDGRVLSKDAGKTSRLGKNGHLNRNERNT